MNERKQGGRGGEKQREIKGTAKAGGDKRGRQREKPGG